MLYFLLSLFLAIQALQPVETRVLDPFMDALGTSEGGRPPDVIPTFPSLFGDETPYRPPGVTDW